MSLIIALVELQEFFPRKKEIPEEKNISYILQIDSDM